jgi:hypothetical protein
MPIEGVLEFVLREALVLYMRYDAYNRVPVVRAVCAVAHSLAERIAVRPVSTCEALVDDRDALRLVSVQGIEGGTKLPLIGIAFAHRELHSPYALAHRCADL